MRFRILATTVLALACSESLAPPAPGDYLVGAWSDGRQAITAARTGAVLDAPCIEVSFAPIRLDDSLAFHVTGTVTIAVGLVVVRPGDSWPLAGRLVGDRLIVGTDTLSPGHASQHVCNASRCDRVSSAPVRSLRALSLLLFGALSSSSIVEPRSGVTLLVTNA